MHASLKITLPRSKFHKMVNEQDIKKALDALNAQLIPNYTEISQKFSVERITLMRRWKGICSSRAKATSLYYKLFTDTQEEALVD